MPINQFTYLHHIITMIQIDRSAQQPHQDTLQQLQHTLQQAQEAIYHELARTDHQSSVSAIEKAATLLNQYQDITHTLHRIQDTQLRLDSIQHQQLITESLAETQQYRSDTAYLIGKLKTRQQSYEEENLLIIQLMEMISIQTASVKEMEVEIKQHRLLTKTISNLKQVYDQLKQQQESSTMFRKIRLTEEKDNNEYILNQIHTDLEQQLTYLKNKREALEQKARLVKAEKQSLSSEYDEALKEFNKQKIKTSLLSQPAKPKPSKPKKKKVEIKEKQGKQQVPDKISEVEAIETEVLVLSSDSKWQLYVSVLLGFITVCVLLQLVAKFM